MVINSNQKVLFILTHVPNPRINKRISLFKELMKTEVICARRKSQDIWEPEQNDVKHTILDIDLPSSSHIIKRVIVSSIFQRKVYGMIEGIAPTIIYAEGLDTLSIAVKYKKRYGGTIIFEVSDVREFFLDSPKGYIKRIIADLVKRKEERLFVYVDKLILTSPKFYECHYSKIIERGKTLFIPNLPDINIFANFKKQRNGAFTIGFIGGIRYLPQMKMLVDMACDLGMNVLFAGAGGTADDYIEIKHYCSGKSNVKFTGRYSYTKDIANLYGMIDCVYSVYDADNANVRIALPNKLYEAIYCELPIIVSKGTYLGELVNEWGVGVSVGHKNAGELKKVLSRLRDDREYYAAIIKKCKERKICFESKENISISSILENPEKDC